MSIESDLQELISKELLTDGGDGLVGADEPLMSSGRVDSMGLLRIVAFVNEQYHVDVLATGGPEDFETVRSLAAAVRRAQGQA